MSVAVVMTNPKYVDNVNAALRSCACYGAEQLVWTGTRVLEAGKHPRPKRGRDRRPAEQHFDDFNHAAIRWGRDQKALERLRAEGFTLVAVELVARSESLPFFKHPEGKTAYVLGPEDGSLDPQILKLCQRVVQIPTHGCLNVAMAIGTVLYDRRAKELVAGRRLHRVA